MLYKSETEFLRRKKTLEKSLIKNWSKQMKSKLFILFVLLSLTSCRKEIILEEEEPVKTPETTETSATHAFTIKNVESFDFPLPTEYRQNISSLQGLRAGNAIYSTN